MKFDKQVSSSQILANIGVETTSLLSFHTNIAGTISGTLYIEFADNADLGWVRDPDLDVAFSSPPTDAVFYDISKIAVKKARIGIEVSSGSARIQGEWFHKGI
jgi:hypothetical protein